MFLVLGLERCVLDFAFVNDCKFVITPIMNHDIAKLPNTFLQKYHKKAQSRIEK